MDRQSSQNTPLEIYHGVPSGWSKAEIVSLHKALGGSFEIDSGEVSEPGAPSWIPNRYNLLQYRKSLYEIGNGVKKGDKACIELAIRYIETGYFGSYSGFIKERLARLLKPQELSKQQIARLKSHFKRLVKNKRCLQEFREYKKLANRIQLSKNA
jgi:Arc/MetJ-type ribon-helix-helix transcriptional regulator